MSTANRSDKRTSASDILNPLAAYRRQHGLTQKEMAQHLDVARETIARWETGRKIDDDLLPRVAERTGISRGELRPDLARLLEEKPSGGSPQ